MLLDLFASECEGRRISVTTLCIASSVPSTTALQWIAILVSNGFVEREDDPDDKRRAHVSLTPKGRAAMIEYLRNYLGVETPSP
ncbi:winged helix DNA-binding protein [Novosphingobium sp. PhB165]|uniref:winged helix DNA-binding protein n=1 Tax=Novosphingobium sp. PhB165 TaxID=2485105 RepID=UPI001FB4B4D4|nr:winged helix DNA-binding protein [Novosphingobium sp. PhB165]